MGTKKHKSVIWRYKEQSRNSEADGDVRVFKNNESIINTSLNVHHTQNSHYEM